MAGRTNNSKLCPDTGRTDLLEVKVKKLEEDIIELQKWRSFIEGAVSAFGWVKTVGLTLLGAGLTLIVQLLLRAMK